MVYNTEKERNLIKDIDKKGANDKNYEWWRKRGSVYQVVEEQYKIDKNNAGSTRKSWSDKESEHLLEEFLNQIIILLPSASNIQGASYIWFLKNQNGNLDQDNIHPKHLLLEIIHKGITKFKDEISPSVEGNDWGKILPSSLSNEEALLGWQGGSENTVKGEMRDLLVKLGKDKILLGIVKVKLKEKLNDRFNSDKYQFERGGGKVGEKAFELLKNKIDSFDSAIDAIYFSQFLLEKRLRFMKGKFEMEILGKHILPGLWDTNKKQISEEFLFERYINYDYHLAEIICNNYNGFGETDPQAKINRLEEELNKFWAELDTIAYITSLKLHLLKKVDDSAKDKLEQRFNQEVIGEERWWNDFANKSPQEIEEKIAKAENFTVQEKLTWEVFFSDPSRNITNPGEQGAWKNSGLDIGQNYPINGAKSEPEVAWDNGWKDLTKAGGVTNSVNKKLTYESHGVKTDNVEPLKTKKDDLDRAHEWIEKYILNETDETKLPTDSIIDNNNNELDSNKLPPGFKEKVKQIRDKKEIDLLPENTTAEKIKKHLMQTVNKWEKWQDLFDNDKKDDWVEYQMAKAFNISFRKAVAEEMLPKIKEAIKTDTIEGYKGLDKEWGQGNTDVNGKVVFNDERDYFEAWKFLREYLEETENKDDKSVLERLEKEVIAEIGQEAWDRLKNTIK